MADAQGYATREDFDALCADLPYEASAGHPIAVQPACHRESDLTAIYGGGRLGLMCAACGQGVARLRVPTAQQAAMLQLSTALAPEVTDA